MEQLQQGITEQRAHTDASLGAERAAIDSGEDRSETVSQQILDDLIERDRIRADARLWKFRDRVDSMLARDRSASPSDEASDVTQERRIADQAKRAEREHVDAYMQGERQRSEVIFETERREQETRRTQLEARRQETDEQLSSERHNSDTAAADLQCAKAALAISESKQGHYGDILGMVTHDLRSPLTVISMSAEMITEETNDPSVRKMSQHVTQAAARMERLLTDLLDVARIQSGTLSITKRPHVIDTLVDEVLKTYNPLFSSRGLTFTVDMPATAVVAWFDHDRIVQVFSNLLGNAMKFTPPGGTVTLHVQLNKQVEFSLSDNGPGIAPTDLPHIFEQFWQIEKASRRGLGLGLFICKQIVAAHGGTIVAESELGHGTTVRFTLALTDN